MKNFAGILLIGILLLGGCHIAANPSDTSSAPSATVSTSTTVSPSTTASTTASPSTTASTVLKTSIAQDPKLVQTAKDLYSEYLDEHVKNKDILDYAIHTVIIEEVYKDGFVFSVVYDMRLNTASTGDFGLAGNGEDQGNGLFTGKFALVKVVLKNNRYVIASQGTG